MTTDQKYFDDVWSQLVASAQANAAPAAAAIDGAASWSRQQLAEAEANKRATRENLAIAERSLAAHDRTTPDRFDVEAWGQMRSRLVADLEARRALDSQAAAALERAQAAHTEARGSAQLILVRELEAEIERESRAVNSAVQRCRDELVRVSSEGRARLQALQDRLNRLLNQPL